MHGCQVEVNVCGASILGKVASHKFSITNYDSQVYINCTFSVQYNFSAYVQWVHMHHECMQLAWCPQAYIATNTCGCDSYPCAHSVQKLHCATVVTWCMKEKGLILPRTCTVYTHVQHLQHNSCTSWRTQNKSFRQGCCSRKPIFLVAIQSGHFSDHLLLGLWSCHVNWIS